MMADEPTGATPAPTVAPSTPSAAPSPSPAPADPSIEFEGLGASDDDFISLPDVPSGETPPAGSPATPPEAPQPGATPPQAAPASSEAPPPENQPTPQEPASPQPGATPPSTPEEPIGFAKQLEANREQLVEALAAERFALSREEADLLETDVAKAIPRFMAKAYYQAVQSTLIHMQNFVPQMVLAVSKALEAQKEADNSFYSAHKAIDRTKHASDVTNFANQFKKANPQITQEDLFALVASAVMRKHGLQPVAAQPNGTSPPQPPVPSFVPARPGASVRVTPEPDSPFAGLGQDFED